MAWSAVQPVVKVTIKPRVKASIRVGKRQAKITIGLSQIMMDQLALKKPAHCRCFIGSDEQAGLIMINGFDESDAKIVIKKGATGGMSFSIPLIDGVPKIDAKGVACEVQEVKVADDADESTPYVIVRLPLDHWKTLQRELSSGPAKDTVVAAPPVVKKPDGLHDIPPRLKNSDTIDLVAYGKACGISCERRGDLYAMRGMPVAKQTLLKAVNDFRAAKNYPVLSAGQVN